MSNLRRTDLGDLFGFARAVQSTGAVSPSTARSLQELPPMSTDAFAALLDLGVLRESTQGTYYVYERALTNVELDYLGRVRQPVLSMRTSVGIIALVLLTFFFLRMVP